MRYHCNKRRNVSLLFRFKWNTNLTQIFKILSLNPMLRSRRINSSRHNRITIEVCMKRVKKKKTSADRPKKEKCWTNIMRNFSMSFHSYFLIWTSEFQQKLFTFLEFNNNFNYLIRWICVWQNRFICQRPFIRQPK